MAKVTKRQRKVSIRSSNMLIAILDSLGLFICFSLAYWSRLGTWIDYDSPHLWVLVFIGMLSMYVVEGYHNDNISGQKQMPINTLVATVVALVVSMAFVYTIGVDSFAPIFGRGVLPTAMLGFSVWAVFWRRILSSRRVNIIEALDWLIVADQPMFERLKADCLRELPNMRVHWVDASSSEIDLPSLGLTNSEGPSTSVRELGSLKGNPLPNCGAIFSSHGQLSQQLSQQLMDVRFAGQPVLTITEFYEQFLLKVPVSHLKVGWFVQARGFNLVHDHIGMRLKRLLDIFFAVSLGLIALPICVLLIAVIRLDSKGGAIFRQTRVGLCGKPFVLLKLRTMVIDAEAQGVQWSTEDDPRITRVGRFLRSSRLDELPQLWNLLKGEMSLIGPRPERPEFTQELEKDIPYYDLRHLVSPGITGWAQVMYPYASSVEDSLVKLEYDLFYIKNHSVRLDLLIILKTISVVLRNKGR